MIGDLSRAIMRMVASAAEHDDQDWSTAMATEYWEAEKDGDGLNFAIGCLLATWWRLPASSSGRHLLLRYASALGLILPLAAFHLNCAAIGLRYLLSGHDPYIAMLAAGSREQRLVGEAYVTAAPLLTFLLTMLGASHLAVAWQIVSRRWRSAAVAMLLTVPVIIGLVLCILTIHPTAKGILLQTVALAVEAVLVPVFAQMDARSRVARANLKRGE